MSRLSFSEALLFGLIALTALLAPSKALRALQQGAIDTDCYSYTASVHFCELVIPLAAPEAVQAALCCLHTVALSAFLFINHPQYTVATAAASTL